MTNILKYGSGGDFTLPFVIYEGSTLDTSTKSTSGGGSSKDDAGSTMDKIRKELLEGLKNVLPGDLDEVSTKLGTVLDTIEQKLQLGTGSIQHDYLTALSMVTKLTFAHDEYDTAKQASIQHGSFNEYAIDSRGRVVVQTSDGFDWKTPEELFKNLDKYRPVTNAELLNFRAHGVGGLAFDTSVLKVVMASPSIKGVTDLIQNVLEKLGKDSVSGDSYARIQAGKLIQGIDEFIKAKSKTHDRNATLEDLYKAKLIEESQARQAEYAFAYVYHTLPADAIALLKMKSDGTDQGAITLIQSLIFSKLTNNVEMSGLSLESGPSDANSEIGKSNPYLELIREQGGIRKQFSIVPDSSNKGYIVTGTSYSALPNVKSDMSIEALLETGLQELDISNKKGITFGDQLLDTTQLSSVMYSNEGGTIVTLPIMSDREGNIRVNFSLIDDYEEVKKEMQKYKHLTPEEQAEKEAELLEKYELNELIDPNTGLPDQTKTHQFLVVRAYTTDQLDINTKSRFIKKLKPSEALAQRISAHTNLSDIDIDDHIGIFEWNYDDLYGGSVFIPLNQHPAGAYRAAGVTLSVSDIENVDKMYADYVKLTKMRPTNE